MKKLLFILTFLPSLLIAQHTIKGTFSPAENYNWVILYKISPTYTNYVANVKVEEGGVINFKMDSTTTKGVYKLVYALPQAEYNFDIIYNAEENIEFTFDEEKGINFIKSSENKLLTSYTKSILLINETLNNFYLKGNEDTNAYMDIIKTLKDAQTNFEEASKGKMVEHFIKANAPYIPSSFEDAKTYSKNVKENYLKHINFNNPILQSSDFLVQRVQGYVFSMVSNPNDTETLKSNVDDVANIIATTNKEYQTFILEAIWNQSLLIDNDEIAKYVGSNYLMPLAKELNKIELTNELVKTINTSIGNVAPNFDLKIKNNNAQPITLHDLTGSKHYLVLFWSSTCGHCLNELPKLKTYLKTLPKDDIKVVAVGLEGLSSNWDNEILKYPDFINVYGEGKWENQIGNDYGVMATPSYFLLDADKHIIAKPDDLEALETYLEENPVD